MQPADAEAAAYHERILVAFDRLLYDSRARGAFIEKGPCCPELGLDGTLLMVFGQVDVRELAQVGRNIRNAVVSGGTGTGQGLARIFPRTLAAIRERTGAGIPAVAEEFIASPSFQEFRDVPYSPRGRGRTLPDCFHLWVTEHPLLTSGASLEPLTYHEAANAVVRIVATGGTATFDVSLPGAALNGGILCLYRDYVGSPSEWQLDPTMYLAGKSRCVVGPAAPAVYAGLVAVLNGDTDWMEDRVRNISARRLRSWGLQ